MHDIKRSLLHSIRQPIKTSIIFFIILLLGSIISGAISVENATKTSETKMYQSLSPIAFTSWNADELNDVYDEEAETMPDIDFIDEETIKQIASLKQVENYDYNLEFHSLFAEEIQGYNGDAYSSYYTRLQGVNNLDLIDIKLGKISLVEGRLLTEEDAKQANNTILVSRDFATINNLSLGSTFTLYYEIYFLNEDYIEDSIFKEEEDLSNLVEPGSFKTYPIELEIVGIFDVNQNSQDYVSKIKNGNYQVDPYHLHNTLLTTNATILKFANEYNEKLPKGIAHITQNTSYNALFILKDIHMLEDFKKEASALLPNFYQMSDTSETLSIVKEPLHTMRTTASLTLYVTIIIMLIALNILFTFLLQVRRFEICTYLMIGKKRMTIIRQVVLEYLMISMLAMSLALCIGNHISQNTTKDTLTKKVQENVSNDIFHYYVTDYYIPSITIEDLAASYHISMDMSTIIVFYGVSFLIIMGSMLVPTIYLLRFKARNTLL